MKHKKGYIPAGILLCFLLVSTASSSDAGKPKADLLTSVDVSASISFDISLDTSNLYLGKYGSGDTTNEEGVSIKIKNPSGLFFKLMAKSNGEYMNSKGDKIPAKGSISRLYSGDSNYKGKINPDYNGKAGKGTFIGNSPVWLYKVGSAHSSSGDTALSFKFTEQIDIPDSQPEGKYERKIVFTLVEGS